MILIMCVYKEGFDLPGLIKTWNSFIIEIRAYEHTIFPPIALPPPS